MPGRRIEKNNMLFKIYDQIAYSIASLLTLVLVCLSSPSDAAIIPVGPGKAYTTIRDALAAAKDGDVILVHKGNYAEGELVVTKSVTIRGVNYPVFDGKNNSQILRIMANSVVVEGLDLRNAGYSSLYD